MRSGERGRRVKREEDERKRFGWKRKNIKWK
jgi:hypothetical protein